jgi:thioester reductase-like protein
MMDVLVTGFPRLIARRVAARVLSQHPDARVCLLVRQKFLSEASAFVSTLSEANRVRILEGDVACIDMGLSGLEWRTLAESVTHIQHHAFLSYEGASSKDIRALNVDGTREVLELARHATQLRRLVHHSTAMVSGDRTGTVYEDELEMRQRFRSKIEESRFVAERLVRREMDKLPVTVLRPGLVVGDSVTGEIDRFDGPYLFVLLILTAPAELSLPLPARGDAPLNLVPMDYVVNAACALMDDPAALGRVVHLVDHAPLHARKVYELVAATAGRKIPRGFIPANVTRAVLRAPGLERLLRSPRAFFEQLATNVTYDSRTARDLLASHNLHCPPFEQYIDPLVQFVRDRLAERRTRTEDELAHDDLIEDPLA